MKILLIGLLDEATGNATTLHRIGNHLKEGGHHVVFLPHKNIHDSSWLIHYCVQEQCTAALGLHAFGAGQYLRHLTIPTIIVFGGTDLNEDVRNPERLSVMTDAVTKATFLVTLNAEFTERAQKLWPACAHKIHCMPQGILTHPSAFSLRTMLHLSPDDVLFLLPSGIREMKDPLYLAEMMTEWHHEDPRIHFVIVGSSREPDFAEHVRRTVQKFSGITVLPPLPQTDLHAAMRDSSAVLNTSQSECSPNSLLEAMDLGVPVVARDIPGNQAIIEKGKTGFLFRTPHECRQFLEDLLKDRHLRKKTIEAAYLYIQTFHSPKTECTAYNDLFADISPTAHP